jgi:hypothetical protein
MVAGWLFLADGRFPEELKQIVQAACDYQKTLGRNQHAENWHPALAGIFLVEVYKRQPTPEVQTAIQSIVDHFVKNQERTGGWFKWFEGAYKDRLDYPVKDLGMLDAIIYGYLWSAKTLKFKVPQATMDKADACLLALLSPRGISYGTGSRGGETTGARGGFCIQGLDLAGQTQHKIYTTYVELLPKLIPKMDQGHHVGAIHGLGVTLGCRTLGPQAYSKLTAEWLDKLIAKQEEDGGVYIGDDGEAGGEKGLLGEDHGSTAAFALMILLQDSNALKKPAAKGGPAPAGGGDSPFSTKKKPPDK